MIPYIDEITDSSGITSKADITQKIIDNLNEGITLPDNMGAVGRFNGTVSKVLLAKALMQMKHDYEGALSLLNEARTGTKPQWIC